ncbi:MAG TPA: hypothetical protein VN408_04260 [Actinoplanes sp.]|nr:hypothetical protein [Actinoplanes sp.]
MTSLVAAAAVLTTAGCTGADSPAAPSPAVSGSAAPSLTYEEAVGRIPMDGTEQLKVHWDTSGVPDTDIVLAARRALAFDYWKSSVSDWTQVVPAGRPLVTETYYRTIMEQFAGSTDSGADHNGTVWLRTAGVDQIRPYQAKVVFCADIGHLRYSATESTAVRKKRAYLVEQDMQYVKTADGTSRWLFRGGGETEAATSATYGADCAKWAKHQP